MGEALGEGLKKKSRIKCQEKEEANILGIMEGFCHLKKSNY